MTRHPNLIDRWRTTALWLLIALGFAGTTWAEPTAASDWRRDGAGFENVVDPAQKLLADTSLWRALATPGSKSASLLDKPITLEHDVPIGELGCFAGFRLPTLLAKMLECLEKAEALAAIKCQTRESRRSSMHKTRGASLAEMLCRATESGIRRRGLAIKCD